LHQPDQLQGREHREQRQRVRDRMARDGIPARAEQCRDRARREAVWRPYSGGRLASASNAKPCGSTSSAPCTPATRSARSEPRSTRCTQWPNRRPSSGCVVEVGRHQKHSRQAVGASRTPGVGSAPDDAALAGSGP
jgi:hypothetical protein